MVTLEISDLLALLQNVDSLPSGNEEVVKTLAERFGSFQRALLSTYLVTFYWSDARLGLDTLWPVVYVVLMCAFNFLILVIMINMLISLIADLFTVIKLKQKVGRGAVSQPHLHKLCHSHTCE